MRKLLAVLLLALAAGCATAPPTSAPGTAAQPVAATATDATRFDALVEDYFERWLALNPVNATFTGDARYNHLYLAAFDPAVMASHRALVRETEAAMQGMDRGALDAQRQLTWDILARSLENARL